MMTLEVEDQKRHPSAKNNLATSKLVFTGEVSV
jgi:hypothetical protein